MPTQGMGSVRRGHMDSEFRGLYSNSLPGSTPTNMGVMTNAMGMNGNSNGNSMGNMPNMSNMANMNNMTNMPNIGTMTMNSMTNMNSMNNMNHMNNMNTMNSMSNVNNMNGNVVISQHIPQQHPQHHQQQQQEQLLPQQQRPLNSSSLLFSQNQSGAYMNNAGQALPQNPLNFVAHNGTQPHSDQGAHGLESTDSKVSANGSNSAFHNPFFGNSYPITNPPLFDSTMLLPFGDGTGTNRRRRISISNGQIGQIVNHEAFFMDEDLMEEFYEQSRQLRPHSPDTPISSAQDDAGHFSHTQKHVIPADNQSFNNINDQTHIAGLEIPAVKLEYSSLVRGGGLEAIDDQTSTNGVAGVPPPNHLLIYNNEVIYNPNNGPIPGTAAWKKERLLERNRVAASKCRQRKKHAQQQLQDNMNKAQNQVKEKEELIKRYSSLLEVYNEALKRHFNGEQGVLETLRKHVEHPIQDLADKSIVS